MQRFMQPVAAATSSRIQFEFCVRVPRVEVESLPASCHREQKKECPGDLLIDRLIDFDIFFLYSALPLAQGTLQ